MSYRRKLAALIVAAVVALTCAVSTAQLRRRPVVAGAGSVNLPYNVSDSAGNQWVIFQNGMLQQRGNAPIYGQGAMLLINGENVNGQTPRAKLDDKTGELIFENAMAAGMSITRRILVKAEDGYIRYIDVVKNPQGQDQTIELQVQTRVNYQLQASQTVMDPHVKDRPLAWVGQTQINRAAVEIYSGHSAKTPFVITSQQDNNMVQAQISLTVPAGKEVAVMHVHATSATLDTGVQMVTALKDSDLFKGVTPELRKIIVNFNGGLSFIGDREVLRGELLDVVELRGGDQLKGTLKEPAYTLHTFYGDVQLPAERIIGMINVGQFRPRQLLVTGDGQVFGGRLSRETISLELSSGQVTQVPLSQISRFGYRKRAGESDDPSADKLADRPVVMLRTGDRIAVAPPPGTIDMVTRYGLLKLRPEAVAAVAFQSEENGVHTVYLTDGSHFAGLIAAQQFTMVLTNTNGSTSTTVPEAGQSVTFPASALVRLQMTGKSAETDENTPTLQLGNGDLFVGSLKGELKVDTAFDTITVSAPEIRTLSHAKDGGPDVQIELWDQSRLSGQLETPELSCGLSSGESVNVPVALVDSYLQPQPQPSAGMVERIKAVVNDLAADDWKQRDRAENQLVTMGPVVAGVLKQLSAGQPPEAQQRIDAILKRLSERKKPGASE